MRPQPRVAVGRDEAAVHEHHDGQIGPGRPPLGVGGVDDRGGDGVGDPSGVAALDRGGAVGPVGAVQAVAGGVGREEQRRLGAGEQEEHHVNSARRMDATRLAWNARVTAAVRATA